jgi:O-antigen/teichoic acid export membrane protein
MWKNVLSLLIGAPLALILIPRFGILGLIASIIASAYPSIIYGHLIIKSKLSLTVPKGHKLILGDASRVTL